MKYLIPFFFLALVWSCDNKELGNNGVDAIDSEEAQKAFLKNAQPASDLIRLNQLGYFPKANKIVSVVGENSVAAFSIINLATGKEVSATTNIGKLKKSELCGGPVQQIGFAGVEQVGHYQIKLDNGLYSHPFEIGTQLYDEVLPVVAKSYYYQRVGLEITEEYGGQWARTAGHLDQEVLYHESTGKTGSTSSAKGWYDAGDFGKYISNGSFAAGQLLHTFERYPNLYLDGSLNIPESGNGVNDLLDEIKYETDWIATMQDDDGGVFHKLTTKRFSGSIMPHEGDKPRYILSKSATATFDFAALLAKMARHYQNHDSETTDKWLAQAKNAYKWGQNNASVHFLNPSDVVTGQYGDEDSSEEQFWAAAELYVTTGEQEYLDFVSNNLPDLSYTYGDGWKSFMRFFGVGSLLNEDVDIPAELRKDLTNRLVSSADDLTNRVQTFDYQQGVNDFQWASNSDVQNVAFVIAEAHRISPKQDYADAVLSSLNYIFGHNGTGYSMITGIGDKSPMNVHHRQSEADDIVEPIPGFVCGGPNYDRQDANEEGVNYPESVSKMHAYADLYESYASNEVCVNWNSPISYLLQFASDAGK